MKPSDGREGREEFTETSYVSGGREREREGQIVVVVSA